MPTNHKLIIGSCTSMQELQDQSCHLIVTSPPYFNAPFDYVDMFASYEDYLEMLRLFSREAFRVLQHGRIAIINIDDMLVRGEKFPIVADTIKIFQATGFRYRDRIIWKKPEGYIRISRRSGLQIKHPYPMYFYPDNITESIIIFQKGRFDYSSVPAATKEASQIDLTEFLHKKWYLALWEITNVLPNNKLEKNIAAFPYELPYRCIKLFSYVGETVLDPFVGSGTTMQAAQDLGRHSIGYDINAAVVPIVQAKLGNSAKLEIITRGTAMPPGANQSPPV